ncbi:MULTISPECIES: methyltransferase domain-containing protein [Streptomyces]|uniref:methyltransferase domain-containing protein n=1 Tax=Streptomyces TaxID=1883 RepID=UPI0022494731|nr:methyltransferase domain-containing protein [Streptomyces sp. JHD 1]MCX2969347.1 methyltransferase domain-containing protein [Streptomyces sp. JHD 1]
MTDPENTRAREFAARLTGADTSAWASTFAQVPRHHFVPSFYTTTGDGWKEVRDGDPGYLDGVYSDTALTTQTDDRGIPNSSSSEPSLMLAMLDALDVRPGNSVFELGTGTGYNAALLCARLGDERVVSVDVDEELVRVARHRLAELGYSPTLAAGDGAAGYPEKAPYDRLIATARLRYIPRAFLEQSADGAVMVLPVGFGVARLSVTGKAEAHGRFLPVPAYFMPRRVEGVAPRFAELETREARPTSVDVAEVLDRLSFPVSLAMPDYTSCTWVDDDGSPNALGLWTGDGSTATATMTGRVRQIGPRRLWDELEQLAVTFGGIDSVSREDFGITVTPDGQRVWYGTEDGPSWALPAE